MLQLQTNYSAINVRWAALQAQLDAYQLSSVTCSFTFAKLNTFSMSWFQSLIIGGESDSWKSSPSIEGEVCWVVRGKKVKGWVKCPLGDSGKWYYKSRNGKGGKEKLKKNGGATSTCGFTGTQKVWVYRSLEGRTFKPLSLSVSLSHSLPLTHTQVSSQMCGWDVTDGIVRRRETIDATQIDTFHVSITSLTNFYKQKKTTNMTVNETSVWQITGIFFFSFLNAFDTPS